MNKTVATQKRSPIQISQSTFSTQQRTHVAMLLILLLAAAIRLVGLVDLSPPGLEHDEVANWLIDRTILDGQHSIYFTAAYGHEAGFHYLQTLFVALLGDNALALRLPAALSGLVLVAITFTLNRRLFGRRVGLWAAALLAVLFWPVFYSRLGLRAITLPVVSGLSIYFWWRGWQMARKPAGSTQLPTLYLWFTVAGLFAGFSLHTYMAGRTVPIFYLGWLLYLSIAEREIIKHHWRAIALFAVVYALVASPLVIFLLTNPGSEARLGEVSAPLTALRAGDLQPILTNSLKIIGMFGWRGDPLWRQNVAGKPVFDLFSALLFYGGVLWALRRWREPRFGLLLLWISTAAIPSIVTIDAPSSIRISNILPFLTTLPALVMHSLMQLSTNNPQLSTGSGKVWGKMASFLPILMLMIIAWHGWRTTHYIFERWPQNDEVAFVWQEALTDAAGYLDNAGELDGVAIGGWTPETMDPPTMVLSLVRDDLSPRYFAPGSGILIPGTKQPQIIHPTILPLEPMLAAQLAAWGATTTTVDTFTLHQFTDGVRRQEPPTVVDVLFGDSLRFVGYERVDYDDRIELLTVWEVLVPAGGPRKLFFHLLNADGTIATQADVLAAPAKHWQTGDILLQRVTLWQNGAADNDIRVGVYVPGTPVRLTVEDGADHVLLEGQ